MTGTGADGRVRALVAPKLHPGDRVRLVSPASFPSREHLAATCDVLAGWGFTVECGDHVLDQWGYMAGRDEDRLADLNAALRDPGVRAVIATRGGAGTYRIADQIDFDAVRADPKPVVGFSDITNLHLTLWRHTGLVTIHECVAGHRAAQAVRTLLTETTPTTLYRDHQSITATIQTPGRASGRLIGGNLAAVVGFIGAGLPDLTGAILFLEAERTIGLGQIDRALTHLLRCGALENLAGIALGRFPGFDDYTDRGWTLRDVLDERLTSLGVPILGGLDLGHGPDPLAIPLGTTATLDTTTGVLTTGPAVRM